jgi:putative ABC transport system permease protein
MSYTVAQRTSEIGIRMAIGARQSDILEMVLRQGAMLGLAGVVLGTLGTLGLSRYVRGRVFGIETPDPGTFLATAGLLMVIILLACYIPARRATRVDPLDALRYE